MNLIDIADLLQQEIDSDPLPGDQRSHLFLIAQPKVDDPEMLRKLLSEDAGIDSLVAKAYDDGGLLREASQTSYRCGGKAKSTPNLQSDRRLNNGGTVLEIQIFEDGGLRLYSNKLSKLNGEQHLILCEVIVTLTRSFLTLVFEAAKETDYQGWDLIVCATNLRSRTSSESLRYPSLSTCLFEIPTYQKKIETTYEELAESPEKVTSALIRHFLQNLGLEELYKSHLKGSNTDS